MDQWGGGLPYIYIYICVYTHVDMCVYICIHISYNSRMYTHTYCLLIYLPTVSSLPACLLFGDENAEESKFQGSSPKGVALNVQNVFHNLWVAFSLGPESSKA